MNKKINFAVLTILVLFFALSSTDYPELSTKIDKVEASWMLISSAFVLIMTPGLSFIYSHLAHTTRHPNGLFRNWVGLDFAGGTVVHLPAGFTALAGAIYSGKRIEKTEHHANVPFVFLGTGLLRFGWFGLNAGSTVGVNSYAVIAFANTILASVIAMTTWLFYERMAGRKMSAVGASIGAVIGLVAITPAAGFVTMGESILIGFVAALISNWMINLKNKSSIDDTLDVFPSHGIGGIIGMLFTGILNSTTVFYWHILALIITTIFAFGGSLILYKIVDLMLTMRIREDQEERGLDISQHSESIV